MQLLNVNQLSIHTVNDQAHYNNIQIILTDVIHLTAYLLMCI